MKLRRLTPAGIDQFAAYLRQAKAEPKNPPPRRLLTDANASEALPVDVAITDRPLPTRLAAAQYLDKVLSKTGLTNIERDAGLWAWLSLFFFEQCCPPDRMGRYSPGELARWIPAIRDAFRYYRHLLAGPYRIYLAHKDDPERALILLHGPLHSLGHFIYQLASRQEFVTNAAVLEAASRLYLEPGTNKPKRGSTSQGAGGVFRFAAVMNQLDVTWDLYATSTEKLLQCLPAEFDKYKRDAAPA